MDPIKTKMTKEFDSVKGLRTSLELFKRETGEYDTQFSKLNLQVKSLEKVFKDLA